MNGIRMLQTEASYEAYLKRIIVWKFEFYSCNVTVLGANLKGARAKHHIMASTATCSCVSEVVQPVFLSFKTTFRILTPDVVLTMYCLVNARMRTDQTERFIAHRTAS